MEKISRPKYWTEQIAILICLKQCLLFSIKSINDITLFNFKIFGCVHIKCDIFMLYISWTLDGPPMIAFDHRKVTPLLIIQINNPYAVDKEVIILINRILTCIAFLHIVRWIHIWLSLWWWINWNSVYTKYCIHVISS